MLIKWPNRKPLQQNQEGIRRSDKKKSCSRIAWGSRSVPAGRPAAWRTGRQWRREPRRSAWPAAPRSPGTPPAAAPGGACAPWPAWTDPTGSFKQSTSTSFSGLAYNNTEYLIRPLHILHKLLCFCINYFTDVWLVEQHTYKNCHCLRYTVGTSIMVSPHILRVQVEYST